MNLAMQRSSWEQISTTSDGRPVFLRELPGDIYLAVTRHPGGPWHWGARVSDPGNPQVAHAEGFASDHQARLNADLWAAGLDARTLGRIHGHGSVTPYGDLADAGSADLMTALGETGWTTEENFPRRLAMLDAYREGWEQEAGRYYPA
jgi:hypothetical protein